MNKKRKSDWLSSPTVPVEIRKDSKISSMLENMRSIGFQARSLGNVYHIWSEMLMEPRIVIMMGIAGAMVPAGLRKVISHLISHHYIDALVTTGANLYHDLNEAIGHRHYLGTDAVDDVMLRELKVDRIYDIFADEEEYIMTDEWIDHVFTKRLEDHRPYSSREVLKELGRFLIDNRFKNESILISAYESNVPIFAPALGDSALGFSIMSANAQRKRRIVVDMMKDVFESVVLAMRAPKTGAIYVGGGVPKNYIQQAAVLASWFLKEEKPHEYAVQISTDIPQWGGLSGATFEEAKSWGKIKSSGKTASAYLDATIGLYLVAQGLFEEFSGKSREVPVFDFNGDEASLKFVRMEL